MLFPATEALRVQERRRPLRETSSFSPSKVEFNMNSLFEQAIALDSATAFTPFPTIDWSFDSDLSDSESESVSKKVVKAKKTFKKFDDLFKCHRRTMRAKHHSSNSNRMVRSKAQFNGLSCLAGSTSSLRSLQSLVRLTASS